MFTRADIVGDEKLVFSSTVSTSTQSILYSTYDTSLQNLSFPSHSRYPPILPPQLVRPRWVNNNPLLKTPFPIIRYKYVCHTHAQPASLIPCTFTLARESRLRVPVEQIWIRNPPAVVIGRVMMCRRLLTCMV